MEKYYTPELEEFHYMFEYEQSFIKDVRINVIEWERKVGFPFGSTMTFERLKENKIRVKYLDKEDIESLGFVETSNDWFTIDAPGKLGYWTQVIIDFRWMHRTEPYKDISILDKRGEENDVIFRGIIKNKSELKVLLKQLNIT